MMKKKSIFSVVVLITLVCLVILIVKKSSNIDSKNTGIEKNYGLSYQSNNITISEDGTTKDSIFDASTVVPDEETIVTNLKNKGYKIEYSDKVLDSNIEADQIIAKKDDRFVNISYNIEGEEESVFNLYNEYYDENNYYILALNGNYVYVVSDDKTFKDAGFTSLANDGIQFINHNNKR